MLDQFMAVLSTCTAATVEHGGTTTHHHAVGRFHRPFYDKQRPDTIYDRVECEGRSASNCLHKLTARPQGEAVNALAASRPLQ
jgi:hypothetical protein